MSPAEEHSRLQTKKLISVVAAPIPDDGGTGSNDGDGEDEHETSGKAGTHSEDDDSDDFESSEDLSQTEEEQDDEEGELEKNGDDEAVDRFADRAEQTVAEAGERLHWRQARDLQHRMDVRRRRADWRWQMVHRGQRLLPQKAFNRVVREHALICFPLNATDSAGAGRTTYCRQGARCRRRQHADDDNWRCARARATYCRTAHNQARRPCVRSIFFFFFLLAWRGTDVLHPDPVASLQNIPNETPCTRATWSRPTRWRTTCSTTSRRWVLTFCCTM